MIGMATARMSDECNSLPSTETREVSLQLVKFEKENPFVRSQPRCHSGATVGTHHHFPHVNINIMASARGEGGESL